MEKQVRVFFSSTNMYASDYMEKHALKLWRSEMPDRRRYTVYRGSSLADRTLLGEVFCHMGIWAFVPFRHNDIWFFGNTRCDAISGYMDFLAREGNKELVR